jgi:hypothetical protein
VPVGQGRDGSGGARGQSGRGVAGDLIGRVTAGLARRPSEISPAAGDLAAAAWRPVACGGGARLLRRGSDCRGVARRPPAGAGHAGGGGGGVERAGQRVRIWRGGARERRHLGVTGWGRG